MKVKLAFIGIVILLMIGVLTIGKIQNPNLGNSNPLGSYRGLKELSNSVGFKFGVPGTLLKESKLHYKSLNGQLVEINNDTISFRAAKFINKKADISGDYNSYKIDNSYNVNQPGNEIEYLRIRTTSDSTSNMGQAIANYNTKDVSYCIIISRKTSLKEILDYLGLKEQSLKLDEDDKSKDKDKQKAAIEVNRDNERYYLYTLNKIGYTIEIPKTTANIKVVEGNTEYKSVAFMISDRAILSIEEDNKEGYDKNLVGLIRLNDGYILKYIKANPFKAQTEESSCYSCLIGSIEKLKSSFKAIEIK